MTQMTLTNEFIDQLTSNNYFITQIQKIGRGYSQRKDQSSFQQSCQIQTIIDEISSTIFQNFQTNIKTQCNHLYQSNRYIFDQIQNIKKKLDSFTTSNYKTESSTAQKQKSRLQTSIFFETDNNFNLNDIRQDIQNMHEDLNNPRLMKSFQFQEQSKIFIDFQIQEKINASIEESVHKFETNLQEKFLSFSSHTEQRIQQLKKTIASIIESINDRFPLRIQHFKHEKMNENKNNQQQNLIHNSNKKQTNQEKIVSVLNKSINMSRGKIKSFFGYNPKQFEEKKNKNSTKLF